MIAPEKETSTEDERRSFIKEKYKCISDCDMCGICAFFHGKDPELAFFDYISGERSFLEVMSDYR